MNMPIFPRCSVSMISGPDMDGQMATPPPVRIGAIIEPMRGRI